MNTYQRRQERRRNIQVAALCAALAGSLAILNLVASDGRQDKALRRGSFESNVKSESITSDTSWDSNAGGHAAISVASPSPVPEPSSLLLLAPAAGLLMRRRRRE